MNRLALCLSLAAIPGWLGAQTDQRPEILILGTYHMANPGHDIHNMASDDVLAPKRQGEISELMATLKRFNPTKIAIEAEVGSSSAGRRYADYLAGSYTLTSNEIDQIGFRLAKELGHRKIYPVDVDGDFPYMRVQNYAKANGRQAQLDSMQSAVGRRVQAQGEFLASHTVLEMLDYLNADSAATRDVGEYYSFVRYGEPWEYAGPDLLAAWYQRNIRIYSNIISLIDSPKERILVIYGAGHLGWLRQNVTDDPAVMLRKLSDLESGAPPLR